MSVWTKICHMMKKTKASVESARERIMAVATDLFYKQGFRATGINEVIEKSGVAKATFYNHFATKDDLCKAYLIGVRDNELLYIDNYITSAKGTLNRFLAPIKSIGPWLKDTEFRGCAFVNIASEVPDFNSPLRNEGIKVYDGTRTRVEQVCKELVASESGEFQHLDALELSKDYMVIFTGTIALAEIYHAIWPVEHGENAVRRLIGETTG